MVSNIIGSNHLRHHQRAHMTFRLKVYPVLNLNKHSSTWFTYKMPSLGALAKFQLVVVICAIGIYYLQPNLVDKTKELLLSIQNSPEQSTILPDGKRLFTVEELAKYDSEVNEDEIYLSILGTVYDVTKGKKHYGKGCTYAFFTGKDASASFITGEFETFTEDSDDVAQLEPDQILSLLNWKKFYDETYILKGKLIGRFYDKNGKPTVCFNIVKSVVAEYEKVKALEKKDQFPSCNIEWSAEKGTRVWCTKESGGIKRNWVGVPRKFFAPGQSAFRCACVQKEDLKSPDLKPYDNCNEKAVECFYTVD